MTAAGRVNLIFASLCGVAILGTASLWLLTIPRAGSPVTLEGAGGHWLVGSAQWRDSGGHWALAAEVRAAGDGAAAPLDTAALQALCGAVLAAMPGAPEGVAGPQAVYRVELDVMAGADADGAPVRLAARPVPVAVEQGRCLPAIDDQFFPSFPPPLSGVYLGRIDMGQTADGVASRVFWLIPREGAVRTEIDHLAACTLLSADPFVQTLASGLARTTHTQINVITAPLAAQGQARAIGRGFDTATGACRPRAAGQGG